MICRKKGWKNPDHPCRKKKESDPASSSNAEQKGLPRRILVRQTGRLMDRVEMTTCHPRNTFRARSSVRLLMHFKTVS